MRINFSQVLKSISGEPIQDGTKIYTLSIACVQALTANIPGDENVIGAQKFTRYLLAKKLYDATEVDVTVEEVVMLKELLSKVFGTAVVGPAFELLN